MHPSAIAQVCHEVNRALQVIEGDPAVSPHWYKAPESQRKSAVEGVREAQAGATPEQLHEKWYTYKESFGWVHGPKKDEDNKTHPCLVPYADLPENQKQKDAVFSAIVKALS